MTNIHHGMLTYFNSGTLFSENIYKAALSFVANPKRAKCDCGWRKVSREGNFTEIEYDRVRDHMFDCLSRIKFKYY